MIKRSAFTTFAVFAVFPLTPARAADDAATLREVTVSARSDAQTERREAVTQKTVIERAEIEALGGLTVGETIRKLPGIDAGQHTGDGAPAANARGMGRDSVQFLIDGERPSANARYALTSVGRLPSGELERIEILRGASAEHGGATPLTVNLVMRKARPGTSNNSTTLKATAGARGSAANGQFSVSQGGGSGDRNNGFSWLLPLTINQHRMPLEKSLARQNADAGLRTLWQEEHERSPYRLDELIVSPRLTWKRSGDSLSLWPSYYRNEGRRDGAMTRSAYADPAAGSGLAADGGRREQEDSRLSIARLRGEGELRLADGGKLSGRAALMGARRDADTRRQLRAASGAETASREQVERHENEFSAALRLDQPTGDQGDRLAAFGLEHATHRRNEAQTIAGASDADFAAREQQWTLWSQYEWAPAKRLTLTAGLRGEHVRLAAGSGAGRSEQQASQLAPSLAARVDAGDGWILRSSLGAGLRAPKLDEISALTTRSASAASTPLEADRAGNPALRPERNINLELAAERHLGSAGVLGVNAWLRRTEDFIERHAALDGARWIDRPDNEGTARHWGLELDAKLRTDGFGPPGGNLRAHLTLPRARVADRRLGITRDARDLPRYQLSLAYEQSLPFWASSAGLGVQHYGPLRTRIAGELQAATARRTVLDAHWVRRLSGSVNLRLQAENLLRADLRRNAVASSSTSPAVAGTDAWTLNTVERGQRTWLLSLEGKW